MQKNPFLHFQIPIWVGTTICRTLLKQIQTSATTLTRSMEGMTGLAVEVPVMEKVCLMIQYNASFHPDENSNDIAIPRSDELRVVQAKLQRQPDARPLVSIVMTMMTMMMTTMMMMMMITMMTMMVMISPHYHHHHHHYDLQV